MSLNLSLPRVHEVRRLGLVQKVLRHPTRVGMGRVFGQERAGPGGCRDDLQHAVRTTGTSAAATSTGSHESIFLRGSVASFGCPSKAPVASAWRGTRGGDMPASDHSDASAARGL
jgi:hypothetical protein